MGDTFSLNSNVFKVLYSRYCEAVEDANYLDSGYTESNENPIQPLKRSQLEKFLKIAFWTSLRQEEGRLHGFGLCLNKGDDFIDPFIFESPILLSERSLAKLAPALDPSTNLFFVWPDSRGDLNILGFASTKDSRRFDLFCEVIASGQLLISVREYGMYFFSVFLTGGETKFVKSSRFLQWLFPDYDDSFKSRRQHGLAKMMIGIDYRTIVTAMRAHNHGGTLLVVPKASSWKESIRMPITNSGNGYGKVMVDVFTRNKILEEEEKSDLIRRAAKFNDPKRENAFNIAENSLRVVANLTAIDGATVVTPQFEILAFGVKIDTLSKPNVVSLTTPFENETPKDIKLSELGGTRHQSAAQFVHEQKTSLAFVVSQDGRISVMKWDSRLNKVCVISPAEFALL